MGHVVDIAAVLSAFAVGLAVHNAAVRVTFAMGRDGIFPRPLGRSHARLMTPGVAISVISGLSIVLALTVGLSTSPYPDGYAYFGTFSTLPVIVVYIITSVALGGWCLSRVGCRGRRSAAGGFRGDVGAC